jgi:putative spermidine/putrescine transport system substrate-binding protein
MKRIRSKILLGCVVTDIVMVFLLLLGTGFLGNAQGAARNELVIQGWGGAKTEAEKKAFFDPFTKETGIKIIPVEAAGDLWGKVAAQVKSKNIEWDLVSGYDYAGVKAAAEKGLLEKVDYKIVTRSKELVAGSTKEWGLGQEINSVCIGYNHKKFSGDNYPKTWADFFDVKKFPGPRAMNNFGAHAYNLLAALMADGVPPDKLIPMDLDRAFRKLDQVKPSVKLWYTSGGQLTQGLISEEVVLGAVFDGRAKVAISMGAPVKLNFNQGFFMINYWAVVKDTPNKNMAMKFLNSICDPERQAVWSGIIKYSCTNPKFIQYLPPAEQRDHAVHADNLKVQVPVTDDKVIDWLAKNDSMITEKWNAWLSK